MARQVRTYTLDDLTTIYQEGSGSRDHIFDAHEVDQLALLRNDRGEPPFALWSAEGQPEKLFGARVVPCAEGYRWMLREAPSWFRAAAASRLVAHFETHKLKVPRCDIRIQLAEADALLTGTDRLEFTDRVLARNPQSLVDLRGIIDQLIGDVIA